MNVLDTDVVIDHLRGRTEARELLERLLSGEEPVVASEVVRYEVLSGARPKELDATERFFDALLWIEVTEDIVRVAADFYRRYRKSHAAIDDLDYLVAATAHVLDAELLTTNVRHYPMFEDLDPAYR